MMPTFRLSDGMSITVPDDASPAEIAEIVADYYRSGKAQEAPGAPPAVPAAETASDTRTGHETPSDEPSDADAPVLEAMGAASDEPVRTRVRAGPGLPSNSSLATTPTTTSATPTPCARRASGNYSGAAVPCPTRRTRH